VAAKRVFEPKDGPSLRCPANRYLDFRLLPKAADATALRRAARGTWENGALTTRLDRGIHVANETGLAHRTAAVHDWLKRLNGAVLVAMMGVMVALVFGNVVARYVFNLSFIWAEELSQYLMVWVTFLGAGLAFTQGRHVAVELLQDAVPPAIGQGIRAAVLLICGAFLAAVVVLGLQFAGFAWDQETPAMNIPFGIPYLAVPIGALLFAVHMLLMPRAFVERRFDEVPSLESEEA
jgi:TRAP-type transport system small permease protein